MWVLQVFGLSGPKKGQREEQLHLKESTDGSCSSLKDCTTTSRDILKMEPTTVNAFWEVYYDVAVRILLVACTYDVQAP